MFIKKRLFQWEITFIIIIFAAILLLIGVNSATAQYWQALPPYNLLWPLWSPALSPPDPVTGVPTPLVSALTIGTILPAQPALLWDPSYTLPYLLYNIPRAYGGGMTYFDPYFGLNPWPPSYLLDPVTGSPDPITLPSGFAALSPTSLLDTSVYYANLLYISQYPYLGLGVLNPITSLLTPGEIWGLTPLI
ncbi:hypothetical protein JXL19_00245 [bacterium]|nr:hypothetical protein [bacterium]